MHRSYNNFTGSDLINLSSFSLFVSFGISNKETSRSDTLVLRRYFQVTEYRVYEHAWDGF